MMFVLFPTKSFAVFSLVLFATAVCGRSGAASDELVIRCLDQGIYYGGALKTDSDFARLRSLGVRHVIDVRSFKHFAITKERRRAAKFGMSFQHLPVGFLPNRTNTASQILSRLYSNQCGSVYFHCNLGKDRAGMLAAIYRVERLGWDPLVAYSHWKTQQFNSKLQALDDFYWQRVACQIHVPYANVNVGVNANLATVPLLPCQ